MKHRFSFLLTVLFLFTLTQKAEATDYCGDGTKYILSYGGQSKEWELHFWTEDGRYKFEAYCHTTLITSVNSNQYGSIGGAWSTLDAGLKVMGNTLYGDFNGPISGSGGGQLNLSLNNGSLTFPMPTDINWDPNCANPDEPVLKTLDFVSASSKTITLKATAIVNNGANQVTEYRVSYGSTTRDITINADGNIVIDGLQPDTQYTFTVKALYKGNESEKDKTIIASTTSLTANLALNKPVTVAYDDAHKGLIVDGDEGSRWSTNGRLNISYDWLQVDLGELYYINSIKIKWEEARPNKYQILLSQDGSNWFVWQHNGAPTKDILVNYPIGGLAAQYIKVVSQANATGYGISIYELQAFGTGVEYTANSSAPTLNASLGTATNTQATINVSATDNQSTPITLFEIDGKMYTAQDGKIVIEPLSPCMQYEWQVRAIDQEGNKSAPKTITYETGNSSPDANIAAMKPTYTGFYEGGLVSSNATDTDNKTRWGGRYRPTGDDEWLVIDLQGLYKINRIEVAWETGTSINYEFKSAWTAEFEQVEVQGVNDDKSLQPAKMCDKLVDGHFSTFEHKNEQPSSAKATDTNDKSKVDSDERAWDIYEYDEPVYARYIQLKSGLNAAYPASLWEFKVYGECADLSHIPVMQWAEVVSYTSDEAELYVSALDYETSEEEMDYEVLVTCGEAGYKQLETTYKFTHEQFVTGTIGHLMVGGLIPDMQYELKIYAIDQDGNRSSNYKTISFTTRAEIGCIFSSTEAYNVNQSLGNGNHSTQIFQKGYTVTIVPGENEFTIIAETADDFAELDPTIFQLLTEPQYLPGGGVIEKVMTKVADKEKTYSTTIKKGDINVASIKNWSGTITFFIKYPFVAKGICLTQPITYDLSNACESAFIIFHHDDQPSSKSLIEYNGAQVNQSIRYYRHFTTGVWEDITMPFEVEEIKVYDTEDHQYYTLNAQYKDGSTTKKGKFLLRKQQDNVSGEQFVPSWYDGNTPLPTKHQPYAIRFTSSYYSDKYVLFCGTKGQTIATSFTKGTAPTADDQYMVFGNPTMMPQNVGTAYLLPTDHSDETYRRTENATVRPFETYVLANANTTKAMAHIGPWRGTPSISTGWEDIEHTLAPQPIVHLYTITGQRLGTWYDCSMQSVADEWAMKGQAGCYIISAGAYTYKIMLK